jgi:hypothetical protein
MGLFDIFRKPKPAVPLPQLCYDIAYFILPHYAHSDYQKLRNMCQQTPSSVGPFFYVMACQMRKIEPDVEIARRFSWHVGQFQDGRDYLTLEYPPPPAVDMSRVTPEEIVSGSSDFVLAPHFSCVIRDSEGACSYYILGQSPIGGGTTLRCITADGANCNLGPGPNPTLADFHTRLSGHRLSHSIEEQVD